jgi:S-adenosyl-L-methionine hydrolase (adenosine-forming)
VIHATETKYFRQAVSRTFHGRDVFAPMAAWLSRGVEPGAMGTLINDYVRLELPQPRVRAGGELEGEVIYRDRFGNLITNISESWVTERWGPPPWQGIQAAIGESVIQGLDSHYAQRLPQELGLIINSWGLFEIFAYGSNAAQVTGAAEGSAVRVCRAETPQHSAGGSGSQRGHVDRMS